MMSARSARSRPAAAPVPRPAPRPLALQHWPVKHHFARTQSDDGPCPLPTDELLQVWIRYLGPEGMDSATYHSLHQEILRSGSSHREGFRPVISSCFHLVWFCPGLYQYQEEAKKAQDLFDRHSKFIMRHLNSMLQRKWRPDIHEYENWQELYPDTHIWSRLDFAWAKVFSLGWGSHMLDQLNLQAVAWSTITARRLNQVGGALFDREYGEVLCTVAWVVQLLRGFRPIYHLHFATQMGGGTATSPVKSFFPLLDDALLSRALLGGYIPSYAMGREDLHHEDRRTLSAALHHLYPDYTLPMTSLQDLAARAVARNLITNPNVRIFTDHCAVVAREFNCRHQCVRQPATLERRPPHYTGMPTYIRIQGLFQKCVEMASGYGDKVWATRINRQIRLHVAAEEGYCLFCLSIWPDPQFHPIDTSGLGWSSPVLSECWGRMGLYHLPSAICPIHLPLGPSGIKLTRARKTCC